MNGKKEETTMRPRHLLAILAVCLLAIGIHNRVCAAAARGSALIGSGVASDPAPAPADYWSVTAYGMDREAAERRAQQVAQEKVLDFLEKQDPPIAWKPTLEFLQQNRFTRDVNTEPDRDLQGNVTKDRYKCSLHVVMSPDLYRKILDQDRQLRIADRQWFAGRVLAVVVLLLVAVGGYFYLDEATKGYHTVLLRLGAISFVGAVGAVLWFVMK